MSASPPLTLLEPLLFDALNELPIQSVFPPNIMSQIAAVRYVAATKKSPLAALLLQCRVKPGASKSREGVTSLNEDAVELCVAAQAREGEANRAVVMLLSKALGLPKSDLTITHGLKSRDKTVAVGGRLAQGLEAEVVARVKELLVNASEEQS